MIPGERFREPCFLESCWSRLSTCSSAWSFSTWSPPEQIDSREAFAALAGEALFGRSGGVILSLIVIVTVLGSLAAVLMAMPRVYFAMARDGLFFPAVAALHPRYQTPARAILIQAVLASLLAVTGTFDEILAYFIVPTVIFLALTVATVLRASQEDPTRDEPLTIPWYPLPPLLFLVQIVILVGLMIMDKPRSSRDRPGCRPPGPAGLPVWSSPGECGLALPSRVSVRSGRPGPRPAWK